MYVMVVIVVLASGFTNEQRLYPMPTQPSCDAALKAAVAAWEGQQARVLTAKCERMS